MEFEHTPVLYDEVLKLLDIKADGIYVDGTAGGGGHAAGIASGLSEEGTLIAVDRDIEALHAAERRLENCSCNLKLLHTNYSDVESIKKAAGVAADGILLDLGVSSYQLDNPERGFSYMHDAPLDMRMDERDSLSAYDVVNGYEEEKLKEIIREYGEENWASRIADFIVQRRKDKTIETTGELVDIIKAAIPANARRTGPHPAKRTFQAIRIEVNDELGHLKEAVRRLPDLLAGGGRIAIITFHSLEDRIVKTEFERRLNPCTCPKELPVCVCGKVADVRRISKKPILPSEEEKKSNPRARSAKLRVLEKI